MEALPLDTECMKLYNVSNDKKASNGDICMDIKKYAVIAQTVDSASLTGAAEELGLTQSGVSHIIASAEAELGLPLLKRTRTGARLTPEGERLIPHIRSIVEAERRLREEAERMRSQLSGVIRIGTYTSVATHWLPGMMMDFQREHPQVEFRLLSGDYHDVELWLADGSIDLAFAALPLREGLRSVALYEDPLLAVLPSGHPLCRGSVCRTSELVHESFIALPENSNHDMRRALSAAGLHAAARFCTKDDYAVIAMVRQGLGVSIMPSLLLRGNNDGVELRPLEPPAMRTIALAYASASPGPASETFAEFAAEWVRKNGGM